VLRSLLFAILFYGWSAFLSPFYVVLLLLPRRGFWRCAFAWCRSCVAMIRTVAGIAYEIRGREHLPPGPAIIASKHQSAWDTLIYNVVIPDCAYVIKRELLWVPFLGWFLWRVGMVGIDRKGGAKALKKMVAEARDRLAAGRKVVIFPQGTRTPPGAKRPYLAGVAALYRECGVPVVPAALNSGLFWPRRRFRKWPGMITIEYLPPIEPGLDRRTFMRLLEERIETATARLEAEARSRFHPPEA
jgi:1-acyl-sn-glycerol-3-phosphate acyltransferase